MRVMLVCGNLVHRMADDSDHGAEMYYRWLSAKADELYEEFCAHYDELCEEEARHEAELQRESDREEAAEHSELPPGCPGG